MTFTRLSGVLLAVALPFAVTGVAAAHPDTSLTLAVTVPGGDTESVHLRCDPAGGTHPNARRACAEIRAAQGNFDSLPGSPEPGVCTMEYRPVTVSAKGTWQCHEVDWQREYSNACMMRGATGTVFLF